MAGYRIRVRSTRGAEDGTGGFRGRRAGRLFDVTAEEYARYGPNGTGPDGKPSHDAGMLELVTGPAGRVRRGTPTDAAIRLAAERGLDLGAVKSANPTAERITVRHVRAFARVQAPHPATAPLRPSLSDGGADVRPSPSVDPTPNVAS